jgi:MFS family permease
MRNEILIHLDDPKQLEKLYQDNKTSFKTEFNLLFPEHNENKLLQYWDERLNFQSSEISWGSKKEFIFVLALSLIAGCLASIPSFLKIDSDFFYTRNISLIIFSILATYFCWKNRLPKKKIIITGVIFLIALIFINLLPANNNSNTLILSLFHMSIFLWTVVGFTYVGNSLNDNRKRIEFLRYNGELLIMSGLLLIAGALLTAITIGLFTVSGFDINDFYFKHIVIFFLPIIPILGTFLTQTNPQLVNKVSPVIAKIFSPLVLITVVVYLIAILFSGKNLYNDRDFLMLFNGLLIGVIAIILFSISTTINQNISQVSGIILFALSVVTVIVCGMALSAILFRISTLGITPNRLAVVGANLLMLTNLFWITFQLFKTVFKKTDVRSVENAIASFIPFYILWTIIVSFVFPLLFNFR